MTGSFHIVDAYIVAVCLPDHTLKHSLLPTNMVHMVGIIRAPTKWVAVLIATGERQRNPW